MWTKILPWMDFFLSFFFFFLQEIVSIYPVLSPPNLTPAQSNRVCNALALLQVIWLKLLKFCISLCIQLIIENYSFRYFLIVLVLSTFELLMFRIPFYSFLQCVASHPDTRMLFLNGNRFWSCSNRLSNSIDKMLLFFFITLEFWEKFQEIYCLFQLIYLCICILSLTRQANRDLLSTWGLLA